MRSLANCYGQYADKHMNLKFMERVQGDASASESGQFDNFTIPAEIRARSVANFYGQYAEGHMNLKFMRRVSERERAIRQFVIVKSN